MQCRLLLDQLWWVPTAFSGVHLVPRPIASGRFAPRVAPLLGPMGRVVVVEAEEVNLVVKVVRAAVVSMGREAVLVEA